MGRVAAVETRSNAAAGWTSVASAMTYQPFGAVESMTLGNGLAAANDRGTDGRLRSRRLTNVSSNAMPVGTRLSDLSYVYDPDGNVTSIDDMVMPERSAIYGYDAVGRLNLMIGEGAATAATYSYTSGTNKLASITTAAGGGGTAGTRSIAYDPRGNPTNETRPAGQAVSLAYDGHGRLTSYARSGEAALTHSYNGLDDRIATTTTPAGGSADTRRFIYAPDGRVLGEYGASASDIRAEFIWMSPEVGTSTGSAQSGSLFGGDDGLGGYMPLAVAANDNITGPQLLWVHGNHMGVPHVFTNASGAQVVIPTGYNLPGFPGQSRTFADLYYNRYRDYDPTTGRYIQADPIGLAGGASPYSYAMNSPLRYTDPQGLFVDTIADVGFVLYDLYRLGKDNVFGENCPGTLSANATALGADLAALFVPGITGLGTASRVAKVHKNSLNYVGDTHFYAIRGGDGSLHKVGQSAQGVRARDGMSRRAERQARALRKKTGERFDSEIRKNFRNKADALTYERRFIETYRRLYGKRPPGNLHGR